VSAYWANLISSGTSSLWNRVIVFQRDGILSTGYFADLTIVFTKLRWKKQSTHVLKKISVHVMIAFWITQFFFSKFNTECTGWTSSKPNQFEKEKQDPMGYYAHLRNIHCSHYHAFLCRDWEGHMPCAIGTSKSIVAHWGPLSMHPCAPCKLWLI
jgi:hypothetical protein